MKAISVPPTGGPDVLQLREIAEPVPAAHQLLVLVRAAGVNRADTLQREGKYPVPPGESDILGLELAGEVVECGAETSGFAVGDRIFALVGSGAYAEFATVDWRHAVRTPDGWDDVRAAAVIEVFSTANETIFGLGALQPDETLLIHAGGSGVGSAGIQMALAAGARVYFTAGSDAKIAKVMELGAARGINYRTHDFAEEVTRLTDGGGVDVVEDFIGAPYLARHLSVLRTDGRLVVVGLMGGHRAEFSMAPMLRKRLKILGFTLRPQSPEQKQAIVRRFAERWLPLLVAGTIQPIIHATYPLADAREAHRVMEANENFGKLILSVN